jgi:hypothetical protein
MLKLVIHGLLGGTVAVVVDRTTGGDDRTVVVECMTGGGDRTVVVECTTVEGSGGSRIVNGG